MDCQLALCYGGGFSIGFFLGQSCRFTLRYRPRFPRDSLDSPSRSRLQFIFSPIHPRLYTQLPLVHRLCHYNAPHIDCHRHALRKIAALSILRIPRLGHSILAVASEPPPRVDLRDLGGARVGLECVPQYQHQFRCSGGLFSCSGCVAFGER